MKKEITMIRFEEHDNQLFRMLEEPVPLTQDSEMPCLTRLIQDDSRMGMFNRDTKPSRLSDFYLAARIVNNNIIVDEFMESDYHRFEIIGYPVADGSADWALYQMMQGKKVTKRHLISHVYWHYDTSPHLKCISEYNCGTLQIMVVPEIWVKTAEPTGWQIYEEPGPAKEPIADCDNCKRACTKSNIDHCHMYEPKPTFKVGDWVRGKSGYAYEITAYPSKLLSDNPNVYDAIPASSMDCPSLCLELSDIESKLDPSEVVLDFGSGIKGWIRRASNHTIEVYSKANCWLANIRYDMLDTETRKLIESLLKAQEEEE